MLQNGKNSSLLFLIIFILFVFETNARVVEIAADETCGTFSGRRSYNGILDSKFDGTAYLNGLNGGQHQKWKLIRTKDHYLLKNFATGLLLDSNHAGSIYTHVYNGGDFQKWQMINAYRNIYWFKNVATGRQLDCHKRRAYTWPPNTEMSQLWTVSDA